MLEHHHAIALGLVAILVFVVCILIVSEMITLKEDRRERKKLQDNKPIIVRR